MSYSLWLCGKKIDDASKIKDNFDLAALRGYYIAGNLVKWLEANGGKVYAQRLKYTNADDPLLNIRLQLAFDIPPRVISVHEGGISTGRGGFTSFTGANGSFSSFTNSYVGYKKKSSFVYSSLSGSFSGNITTFPTSLLIKGSYTTTTSKKSKRDEEGRLSTEHITQFGYGIELI
ncbi:MAG: hypothetical protein GX346_07515 [Clostridiales bacterium]|nr:hypothetical protein [Clostridiales bacterium]